MPQPATPKQEAFARYYFELGNASEAYRLAYDAENMQVSTVHENASRLLRNSKVAASIEALKRAVAERVEVTAADIARVAWEIASNSEIQTSARVSALALLAKRHPEFSEKHDINANVRMQALQAVAFMTEEQLLALAGPMDDEDDAE